MEQQLLGKPAVVTGASRGIGREIARSFALHGAKVTAAARNLDELRILEEEVRAAGGDIQIVQYDALNESDTLKLVEAAESANGPTQILVNAAGGAGTYVPGGNAGLLESPLSAVNALFALNVAAPFALSQAVANRMAEHGGGSIINLSSRLAQTPNPAVGVYCAMKAAVASMTVTWAQELGPKGIRVNAIAPGGVATDNMDRILNDEDLLKSFLSHVPLGRLGTTVDAANCAVFLASDAASWVSGSTILLSGGRP